MATTVDWAGAKIISVPKADMTLVTASPYEIRRLDLDAWRIELRDLEDDPDGRPWPKTHLHNTEKTLAGLTYARQFEIIPPYTVTFENGNYAVEIVGANHNLSEVINLNNVSFISSNSAGLIDPNLEGAVWDSKLIDHEDDTTFGGFMQTLLSLAKFFGLK